MNVLLSTIGTRGDVQPLLALACELRRRGHAASLCAAPNFRDWVEAYGVRFVPIGPDLRQLPAMKPGLLPTPEQMQALAEQSVRDQFRVLSQAAAGCDVIVAASALQIAARSVAEHRGARYVFAAYAPNVFPSSALLPARTSTPHGASANISAAWFAEAESWNTRFRGVLNAQRKELALAPVDDVMTHLFSQELWLAADPLLAPLPQDTAFPATQAGAWFLEDNSPLPPELVRFLDAGEPPIYFGLGSMRRSANYAAAFAAAARALGQRAVFAAGWGGLAPAGADDDILGIGEVNHALLFERVAAVVHHGGAGTTHAAARAGRPQVVVPQLYDQFYWGRRVEELEIGSLASASTESEQAMTESLSRALLPERVSRAVQLQPQIIGNAVVRTADLLGG